jgi:hypothetical protein
MNAVLAAAQYMQTAQIWQGLLIAVADLDLQVME